MRKYLDVLFFFPTLSCSAFVVFNKGNDNNDGSRRTSVSILTLVSQSPYIRFVDDNGPPSVIIVLIIIVKITHSVCRCAAIYPRRLHVLANGVVEDGFRAALCEYAKILTSKRPKEQQTYCVGSSPILAQRPVLLTSNWLEL